MEHEIILGLDRRFRKYTARCQCGWGVSTEVEEARNEAVEAHLVEVSDAQEVDDE